jgi:hypothetical protein
MARTRVNLIVPAGLGTGDVPLVATVGGVQTPSGVVMSLAAPDVAYRELDGLMRHALSDARYGESNYTFERAQVEAILRLAKLDRTWRGDSPAISTNPWSRHLICSVLPSPTCKWFLDQGARLCR